MFAFTKIRNRHLGTQENPAKNGLSLKASDNVDNVDNVSRAHIYARGDWTSSRIYMEEEKVVKVVKVITCGNCQHFEANPHTPTVGLGSCTLRSARDWRRGQWPARRHYCREFNARGIEAMQAEANPRETTSELAGVTP